MDKALSLQNTDPLGNQVRDKLQWSPLQFGIVVLIANVVIDFIGAVVFHAFYSHSGLPGLFQDIVAMAVDFVMMPVVGGYYIWTIISAKSLIQTLGSSGILTDDSSFNRSVRTLRARLRSKLALGVSLVIAVIVSLLLIGTFLGWYPWAAGLGWLNHSNILTWLRAPMWLFTTYALSFTLFNIAVTIITLRDLFRHQSIRISPWHPDKCGGLKSISQYSLVLSYAIAMVGTVFSFMAIEGIRTGTFSTSYLNWVAFTAYVVLAPLIFFLPLGTAHVAMQEAKHKSLLFLAQQIDIEYERITRNPGSEAKVLEERVGKLEQWRKLYGITEEFPVWPFDIANLRRFLAVVTAPIVPTIISLILDLIRSSLHL